MKINSDELFKIIGMKEVEKIFIETENIELKKKIEKLNKEKEEIQKTLKSKIEDV